MSLYELLGQWREAERLRNAAPPGSPERRQADLVLRHARDEYDAECVRHYGRRRSFGSAKSSQHPSVA